MITKFNCTCGNTDNKKVYAYDGALGYEALVCTVCGRYYDYAGEHPSDDWSNDFIRTHVKKSIFVPKSFR